MSTWDDRPSPMAERLEWHRQAAERDVPTVVDDSESSDPYHPWRGIDPDPALPWDDTIAQDGEA